MPPVQTNKDVDIVLATQEELAAYAALDPAKRDVDFCAYLKKTRQSSATEVIADFSGQTFSGLNLNNLDLGNIIATERDERYTQFQNCQLKNTKFRSKTSMNGLEFTHCNLAGALFGADLNGVNFGINCDITGANFKAAYNIDKCIISSSCKVAQVDLGFPDLETFKQHMDKKLQDQELASTDHKTYEAEVSRRKATVPAAPDIEMTTAPTVNPGTEIGLLPAAKAVAEGFKNWFDWGRNTGSKVLSTVGNAITATTVIGADQPIDKMTLHRTAIERIIESDPKFSPTIRNIDESDVVVVSEKMVRDWVKDTQGSDKGTDMPLSEYVKVRMDWEDKIPHLQGVDLRGINFSGLDFGDIVISKCNFSDTKFNQCNLDEVSLRDCNFSGTEFIETTANGADFTRCSFKSAKIDKTSFKGARLVDTDFSPGYLPTAISNTNLDHADMRSSQLDRAKIISTSLNRTNMQYVTGDGAMLFNVVIDQANLTHITLTNASLKDVKITNSIASDANLAGVALERVTTTDLTAPGIRLDDSDQRDVEHTRADLSNGTMNKATLGNVTIDSSKILKIQAQEIKTHTPSLSSTPEEDEVIHDVKTALEAIQLKDTIENDRSFDPAQSDEIVDALEAKQQQPTQGLVMNNVDGRGADFSGSHLGKLQVNKSDLSHMKGQNMVLESGNITKTNQHGADLSGAKLIDTSLEEVGLTHSHMDGLEARGGKWHSVDVQGAHVTHAILGTEDSKLRMNDITADIATTFAHTTVKTVDPDTIIKAVDKDGISTEVTPDALIAAHTRQDEIMQNDMLNAGANQVSRALSSTAAAASAAASTLEIHKKKSRMGLIVGIIGGVIAGGIITIMAASTFGLGLVPIAIVAATTIGGCAIGGGIAGHLLQNTTKGKGVLAIATAGAAAIVLGPVGLVAAPAVALYNSVTGKTSGLRSALGSALRTIVANPITRVANFVASGTYSNEEIVAAQEASQERQRADNVVNAERDNILRPTPNIAHDQAVKVATQVTSNEQHAPVVEQKKSQTNTPKTQSIPKQQETQLSTNSPKPKTGWRDQFTKASTAIKNLAPKKKMSHTEALSQSRATPSLGQQK